MNFEQAEKIFDSIRKKPKKTIAILLTLIILFILYTLLSSFLTEKVKQLASPAKQASAIADMPSNKGQEAKNIGPTSGTQNSAFTAAKKPQREKTKKDNDKTVDAPRINQHTEGSQSPAIISDRDVTITYGESKKQKASTKD